MSGKYDQFKNMSLDELKDEYYNCKNEEIIKKEMLKKIIKSKIAIEKQQKQQNDINQKKLEDEKIKQQQKQQIKNAKLSNEISKGIDRLISLKENAEKEKQKAEQLNKIKELDPIIKKRGNMEQYWESNQKTKQMDPKFVKEISTDHSNNKLMERLNCELDFRIYGEKSNDDIIKPYSNSDEGNFRDFEKYSIPATSFVPKKF